MNQSAFVSSLYGGYWSFGIQDFCYLVNPYFPSPLWNKSLHENLDTLVHSYPSTNWYISSLIAQNLGLTHNELVVGNGASELIAAISRCYVKDLAVPVPNFDEYANRARIQGKHCAFFPMDQSFKLNINEFLHHIRTTGANSVVIVNPNNPTGTLLFQADMLQLVESLRDLDLIIIDESFLEFSDSFPQASMLRHIDNYPNLIIIKSLSKVYGIAGLRLGYAASSNKDFIESIRSEIPIWSINSLAQFFVEEMGKYHQEFIDSCAKVRDATQFLFEGLKKLTFLHPYPTQGNFVLCNLLFGLTASKIKETLYSKYQILVNDCSHKQGLNGEFIRISSRTKEENATFLQAIQRVGGA